LVTYVHFISPLVGCQEQSDALYFDLRNVSDFVQHSLVLNKLSAFEAFWWLYKLVSQLTIQPEISDSCFWYFFLTFEVLSRVRKGFVLRALLVGVFINGSCDAVAHSKYLLFADDIKIYQPSTLLNIAICYTLT
jgi:hypothetical protein